MAKVPQSCIYDWKYGRSIPSANKLKNIAIVLNVPLDEIVDDYDKKNNNLQNSMRGK